MKQNLKQFTHNVKDALTLEHDTYKQWVFRYTFLELEKDLGQIGDVTTRTLFEENRYVSARIVAKQSGVLAGVSEIEYFLIKGAKDFRRRIKGEFDLNVFKNDGDKVGPGDVLMEISGDIHDLLAVERVVLNLLMRMSGVATFTSEFTDKLADSGVLLTPTRKTLWGLLDKRAVVIGGGGTHRLNLGDAIIVKDTHLDALNGDFGIVVPKILMRDDIRFAEIEVESDEEARSVLELIANLNIKTVPVLMFDNFSADKLKDLMSELKKDFGDLCESILFEASGGIKLDNVRDFADSGVDIISSGALTMGAPALDLTFLINKID